MGKLTKKNALQVVEELNAIYPNAECALEYGSVFQLLVAVVLSAQTTDKSVNEVTPILFGKYPDAASLAQVPEEELRTMLRRIGMYRTKAKNVHALSKVIAEEYGGMVPEDFEKLQELPGVGRKTANVVLSVGFGQQRIAVDTHVFRLANRIGLVAEPDVLKTELALMKTVPEHRWSDTHHALIWHGRRVCTARNPKCEECGIADLCKKNNLDGTSGKKTDRKAESKEKTKGALKGKK